MNINGLSGNIITTPTNAVDGVQPSNASPSGPPAAGQAAWANISTPGQFFGDLQQLSQQDPTQFKAVASQLATSFQSAASQASGPQAKFLSNVANQLSEAAQTGSLQPPQAPPAGQTPQAVQGAQGASGGAPMHHHHHHHGGGGGGGMGDGSQSSAVQQVFQNAMGILSQALQASSSGSSSPSGSSSST